MNFKTNPSMTIHQIVLIIETMQAKGVMHALIIM